MEAYHVQSRAHLLIARARVTADGYGTRRPALAGGERVRCGSRRRTRESASRVRRRRRLARGAHGEFWKEDAGTRANITADGLWADGQTDRLLGSVGPRIAGVHRGSRRLDARCFTNLAVVVQRPEAGEPIALAENQPTGCIDMAPMRSSARAGRSGEAAIGQLDPARSLSVSGTARVVWKLVDIVPRIRHVLYIPS